jgi:hypothetical protein
MGSKMTPAGTARVNNERYGNQINDNQHEHGILIIY